MKVILDNGHGRDTAGKRSPDGRLREYAYTREMARRIAQDLKRQGIDVSLLVPEDTDVPLKERVERANRIYAETGKQAILVSIHVNAAGNGSTWFSARGWSVFVDPAASQDSERLATSIAEAAGNIGLTVRMETGGRNYWVSS
ncbi:N-acetylmuramoyl-L-alanine amidase, partial [Barnesiella intestinihominis]